MSRKVTVAAMLALGGGDASPMHANADQEIIALERGALDKWAQSNPTGFVDILADDATWFDFTEGRPRRVEGSDAIRQYVAPFAEQIPPHMYDIVNPKVQVYDNVAILTFHWRASLPNGDPMPEWKVTSVYRWEDGTWRQVHAHWSLVQGADAS
jgi:uncharacterized protein (TIGR02246 family)